MKKLEHISIMPDEVLKLLSPGAGESVLDCTLGLGGHALLFLQAITETGSLTGIDADQDNIALARERLSAWENVTYIHANFLDIASLSLPAFDCIFADLGMSSPHVDDPERGFTFREDAPLDMRYDRTSGQTAAELISSLSEEDLANVLYHYGELRQSRPLSRALKQTLPHTTGELRSCTESVVSYRAPKLLPQIFQALRIAVNQELEALENLLTVAPTLLKSHGRLGILTFHSLEDRAVKTVFRALTTPEKDPDTGQDIGEAPFILLTKKPIVPSSSEITANPRSRSAKLRVIQKRA